jgi:hypothetical protein
MPVIKANRVSVLKPLDANSTHASLPISSSIVAYGQGISIGNSAGSLYGRDTGYPDRYLQIGQAKSTTEGSPSAPSLNLQHKGMWRFRWVVTPGVRSVSILCKQQMAVAGTTPSIIIRANPNVGLNADISGSALVTNDWSVVGPVTFTSTGTDVMWVEVWNNSTNDYSNVFFDHVTIV